jgi:carbon-monoxide dehydrogenase large subunit
VGEAGSIASPAAVVNAVVDALSPFGIEHIDMPVTPEKVWKAMHGQQPTSHPGNEDVMGHGTARHGD